MATIQTSKSEPQQEQQDSLDAIIQQAKKELEQLFARRKQVIRTLGRELEKGAADASDVCRQIKAILKEEIAKKLISGKDIERYCLEKWKKKTKPKKNDKTSIPEEDGGAATAAPEEQEGEGKQEESEELLGETYTIPAEKFGAVIEAIRLSKKGCSLRFSKNYELVSVQAD